jgi:hypothetical protein
VPLASLDGGWVYPLAGLDGSAIAVYLRARSLLPFDFLTGSSPRRHPGRSPTEPRRRGRWPAWLKITALAARQEVEQGDHGRGSGHLTRPM